jgi:hypothetical protein
VKRHAASLVAVLAALAGCGGWEGGKTPGTQTVLEIKAWPNGKERGGAPREWKLYCERAGGTHPRPEKACERLLALDDAFAPTQDTVCTEIYGGPAVAEIQGLYRGETVDATFTRTDGCEIARWDRHAFLFPISPGRP